MFFLVLIIAFFYDGKIKIITLNNLIETVCKKIVQVDGLSLKYKC